MSQSLADLFAVITSKKKTKHTSYPESQEDAPSYPSAESLTNVIPPDNGKSIE